MTEVIESVAQNTQLAGVEDGPARTSVETSNSDDERSEHLVPVSESRKYRKRAQAAEQRVAELEAQMQQHQEQVAAQQRTIDQLHRRAELDAILTDEQAIDLEAARVLAEQAMSQMQQPDAEAAVAELKRSKPFLFHPRRSAASGVPAPRGDGENAVSESLNRAAADAAQSGKRSDLLRYLRLRRR